MLNKAELQVARLMKRARQIARQGVCTGWVDVLAQMKAEGEDLTPLQASSHAAERTQIDALCVKTRMVALHKKSAKKPDSN